MYNIIETMRQDYWLVFIYHADVGVLAVLAVLGSSSWLIIDGTNPTVNAKYPRDYSYKLNYW